MSDIFTTTELKEYILKKLAMVGVLESEIDMHLYFGDMCNHRQNYVYYKDGKYCYTYIGIRESECFTRIFDTKEELLKQVIEQLAVAKVCTGKTAKKYEEYVLELALQIDDKVAELMKNELESSL